MEGARFRAGLRLFICSAANIPYCHVWETRSVDVLIRIRIPDCRWPWPMCNGLFVVLSTLHWRETMSVASNITLFPFHLVLIFPHEPS